MIKLKAVVKLQAYELPIVLCNHETELHHQILMALRAKVNHNETMTILMCAFFFLSKKLHCILEISVLNAF